ncbi:hypothetical protein PSTT_16327 [Puccinia striiformis]|uniref:Uncharacterized protein n=1 Tax=Puccinia striiformis TaxID=27350 RepID=A0A2S4UDJ6_9BASI|nr:hypothetical protein PSTT_16327 [Puccinia striiformis]
MINMSNTVNTPNFSAEQMAMMSMMKNLLAENNQLLESKFETKQSRSTSNSNPQQPIKRPSPNKSVPASKKSTSSSKNLAPADRRHAAMKKTLKKKNLQTPSDQNSPNSQPRGKGKASDTQRGPHQMFLEDYPEDFLSTKDCVFAHIRLLWGMIETASVPPAANPELVQQFCARFTDISQFNAFAEESAASGSVADSDISMLQDARAGAIKVGKHLVHIDDNAVRYIHAYLGKLGIRVWGPNLFKGPESIYNSACRMAAINTLQQVASSGVYNFMNFNRKYLTETGLFIRTYNHFVHHLLKKRFDAEVKNPGAYQAVVLAKNSGTNRSRLAFERQTFASSKGFPRRYQDILKETNAHSDDEWDPEAKCWTIKTLGYRSTAGNIFLRRLDEVMQNSKAAGVSTASRKRIRRLPKEPVLSSFTKAPKSLALDFYSRRWLQKLQITEQLSHPDITKVAFLPDPIRSLWPTNNPAHDPLETMKDNQFSKKFLPDILERYNLSDPARKEEFQHVGDGEELADDEEEENDGSVEDVAEPVESPYLAEGDWVNHYISESEDDYNVEGPEDAGEDEEEEEDYKEEEDEARARRYDEAVEDNTMTYCNLVCPPQYI